MLGKEAPGEEDVEKIKDGSAGFPQSNLPLGQCRHTGSWDSMPPDSDLRT